MKMSEIMSAYESAYGTAEKTFLAMLGGDPYEIAERVAALETEAESVDDVACNFFGFGIDTTPEEDLHNEIIKEITHRYFSGMPRESALAVGNVLGDLGEFRPCATIRDLVFNSFTFVDAWNASNTDEKPIRLNAAAYFSV